MRRVERFEARMVVEAEIEKVLDDWRQII